MENNRAVSLLSTLLSAIILLIPVNELRADEELQQEYVCDSISIDYVQTSSWNTSSQANVTLTNETSEPIEESQESDNTEPVPAPDTNSSESPEKSTDTPVPEEDSPNDDADNRADQNNEDTASEEESDQSEEDVEYTEEEPEYTEEDSEEEYYEDEGDHEEEEYYEDEDNYEDEGNQEYYEEEGLFDTAAVISIACTRCTVTDDLFMPYREREQITCVSGGPERYLRTLCMCENLIDPVFI